MDVFVIPVQPDRYELYCEQPADPDEEDSAPEGMFGKLRSRFGVMLRAAEERQRRGGAAVEHEAKSWAGRVQDHLMGWIAERIAEQRLLWNLRRETSAVAVHPHDLSFEQVHTIIRRILQRDYERHRRWLVVDSIFLVVSGALMLVPGPNVVAYYFAFRVVGHWLSMRGAAQGLHEIEWTGRPCEPLGELREIGVLEPQARAARLDDIAARLRLPHLSAFFERVAVRHA